MTAKEEAYVLEMKWSRYCNTWTVEAFLKGFAKSNPTFTISNPTITKSNPRFVYVARVRRFSDSLVIHIEIKIMHYEAHIRILPLLGQTSAPSFGAGFGQ
jgi:hypothetical protein